MIQTSILTNNCDAWDLNVLLVYFKDRKQNYILSSVFMNIIVIFNPKSDKKC